MISKQNIHKYLSGALLVVASVLLFFAQSAYWVNHTVFNQANFTQITSTALLTESSRDAIATSVVDRALQDRPVVKRLVGSRIVSVTSGLLGSDLSAQALNALSNKTYAYLTSKDRQDIKIELTSIKKPLTAVVALVQTNESSTTNTAAISEIPDEIVLVQTKSLPNFSGVIQLMLWLGPLFWLSTFLLFGLYIYIGRADYAKRVYTVLAAILVVAVLGLLTAPAVPPAVAAAIPKIELRPVLENITAGFLAPFTNQMYTMIAITLVALLAFNQRFNMLKIIKSVEVKAKKPSNKKTSK